MDDFNCIYKWDKEKNAVLSLLQAQRNIQVCIEAISSTVNFTKGDVIQVGVSCNFTQEQIMRELSEACFKVALWFPNDSHKYAVLLASAE